MTADGICIQRLSFRIGSFSISEMSLTIRRGEYLVLTGPNGAGKTVLLRLIAGLYQPLSGEILVNGISVTRLPPWERNIGMVQQDSLLFPNRTVRQNIEFGLELRRFSRESRRSAVEDMAAQFGVSHLLDRTPEGLSGGERQKVSLARTLVLKPAILLLDEPVSAIDEEARDGLCAALKTVQQRVGVTTIHVSHNSRETQLVADRVARVTNGQLIRIGFPKTVDMPEAGGDTHA